MGHKLAPRSFGRGNAVGIVKARYPFTTRIVNSQRVSQTMWPLNRRGNGHNGELHAMPLVSHIENLAIKVQKSVEEWVAILGHNPLMLSLSDN